MSTMMKIVLFMGTIIHASSVGGWRCELCMDVVTTFRESHSSLGNRQVPMQVEEYDAEKAGQTSEVSNHEDLQSQDETWSSSVPGCAAFGVAGTPMRNTCILQRIEFASNSKWRHYVWSSVMNEVEPYNVCAELGKCPVLTEGNEDKRCFTASQTSRCRLNANCGAMQQHCTETCNTCVWLVRSWPRFGGVCAPAMTGAGGVTPVPQQQFRDSSVVGENVTPNTNDYEVSGVTDIFMETREEMPLTSSEWRAKQNPKIIPRGRGSPDLSSAAVDLTSISEEVRQSTCLKMWNAISYVPELWAAVTVEDSRLLAPWKPFNMCRCLSQCPYNSLDSLAVEEECAGVAQPFATGVRMVRSMELQGDGKSDSNKADGDLDPSVDRFT